MITLFSQTSRTRGITHLSPDQIMIEQSLLDLQRMPLRATGYICPKCHKHCLAYTTPNGETRITCDCKRCECNESLCAQCGGCEDVHCPNDKQCRCERCSDCGEWYNPDKEHECSVIEPNYRERAAFDELNAGVMGGRRK